MHTPSLSGQLVRLGLEVVVILGAALILSAVLRRRGTQAGLGLACAGVVAVAAVALIAGQIRNGASLFNQARKLSFSRVAAADYCFGEGWPQNPGGAGAARLPFARHVRAAVGRNGVYALSYEPPPDPDCVLLGLLPGLPASPGQRADWAVAFGRVPAAMRARAAAHDPSVSVFGPGLALQHIGR